MEYIIQRLPKFLGVKESRTNYERAIHLLDFIDDKFVMPYREVLLDQLVNDKYKAPEEKVIKRLGLDGLEVELEAHRKLSPSYKGIVESWENCIKGTNFLASTREISGMIKREGQNYVTAPSLVESFLIGVSGNINPTLELNVISSGFYNVNSFEIPENLRLSREHVNLYWNAVEAKKIAEKLVKDYKKALKEISEEINNTDIDVTKKSSYAPKSSKSEKTNWAGVVKTLVTMPTEKDEEGERELEILADYYRTFADKQQELGELYALKQRNGEVYIGIDSVFERIQYLKTDKSEVVSTRIKRKENLASRVRF